MLKNDAFSYESDFDRKTYAKTLEKLNYTRKQELL